MADVGPLMASKLNEVGIKLAKEGQTAEALAVYEKAHRVVQPVLRYKVSLNAALACHQAGDTVKALALLKRCEAEYGGSFDKLERIKKTMTTAVKPGQRPAV